MNDEYEQMKVFNPYIQMALGILAGNSGVNKSQAFSNAMGGALGALNAAERSQAYGLQTRAQAQALKMKQDEYQRLQKTAQMQKDYFQKMLQNPDISPEERMMAEMGAMGDTDTGIKLMSSMAGSKDKAAMRDLQLQTLLARKEALEAKMAGTDTSREPLDYPEGHALYGWSKDAKGNLYDPKGIEVTGDKKIWATDDPSIPYKNWKDKSNPNMIIPPQNFENWQDEYGNNIQESMTPADAATKGLKYYSPKQIEDRKTSRTDIRDIELQMERLFGKEAGVFPNLKGMQADSGLLNRFIEGAKNKVWRESGAATDPVSMNLRKYQSWAEAFLSRLSKAQGEVGVLTQQDVERVKGLLAQLIPNYSEGKLFPVTEEEAFEKMKEIYMKFASKGVRSESLDLLFGAKDLTPESIYTKSGRKLID